jgi:RHH-type proline utilization regulon transcriptional repressor/proline dehydrogenase/delta 1-pyrroline-5-carboxylate dehydrogenase
LYVNRNIIGAVVGVQPFGGRGLSGTGPKAGGPLYLGRLVQRTPVRPRQTSTNVDSALLDFAEWLVQKGLRTEANIAKDFAGRSELGLQRELVGPVGERNLYALHSRGRILIVPATEHGLHVQMAAALSTGNQVVVDTASGLLSALSGLPATVALRVSWTSSWEADGPFSGALIEGDIQRVRSVNRKIATLDGPLVLVQSATTQELLQDPKAYCLDWLLEEVSMSINTAAAGGNASLMTIG